MRRATGRVRVCKADAGVVSSDRTTGLIVSGLAAVAITTTVIVTATVIVEATVIVTFF